MIYRFALAQVGCMERSGTVEECLTRDRGAAGSSLTGVTALCPWARHINPSLVLVQPRKTRPCITKRLVMGRKESNQANKIKWVYNNCKHNITSLSLLAGTTVVHDVESVLAILNILYHM